ncbi:MAG: type II secretion system F family protein [Phycisphaerales bacterium]|nr:type II secretion system F family protein [Phycisphaerales bacterium]
MTLKRYNYKALDSSGKSVRSTMNEKNEDAVFARLSEQGLIVLEVQEGRTKGRFSFNRDRVSQLDIALLTREMNALLEANIPLARGLLSIGEHEKNHALRDMVIDIASMIEAGEKITAAFSKYESVFGEVYIQTLRSAEKSGRMAAVTSHLADMLERNSELRQMIRRAMSYPLIVIGFVGLALGVIVIFVVPRFATIFESNGVELPLSTLIVKTVGVSITTYWWAYSGCAIAAVVGLYKGWQSTSGRYRMEVILHKTPYISKVLTAITTARFSSVLSIGLESGIEVIEAIEIAGMSTGRPVFQRECNTMCIEMRNGGSLEDVINNSKSLPNFARRLIGSGKDSQELGKAGRIIARHYNRTADHLTKSINTIIEPMITIAMAGIVLLIALSVFLPMWQMISINK